ncbi:MULTISPECIES: sporulation peptidase YabG [Anaerosinus]|uniref:Sporulation peptidase YabG n=1 Tax=Selenobaculum gibii TaxID=3054208 RepID=A0A9Y2AJ14_9FIRM|nr:sporulation peptidase YabG [Selenobaculum gbiensis]WIW70931.1 sporulation peptidase YabG [Selenobaculum gbiensis]
MAVINVGDLVVRKSHDKDIIFKVIDINRDENDKDKCVLKGMHMRLVADAPIHDLEQISAENLRNEVVNMEKIQQSGLERAFDRRKGERRKNSLFRGSEKKVSFFEIPGRVLHIDGDEEYLRMCLKTYKQLNMEAVGKCIEEVKQPLHIAKLVEQYRPDILVLTGHDALIGGGKKDLKDIKNYRHSAYFVESVKQARMVEPNRDDLVIFAGACQSHFEAILAAGANFASSPIRIFIHAYDPVFIAEKVAFTPINRTVDVCDAITASVTGVQGVGGIETRGKFRLGLPKTPYG